MHTAIETSHDLSSKLASVLREANYRPAVGGLTLYAVILLGATLAEFVF